MKFRIMKMLLGLVWMLGWFLILVVWISGSIGVVGGGMLVMYNAALHFNQPEMIAQGVAMSAGLALGGGLAVGGLIVMVTYATDFL